jgi:DNA-binding response OmpR family regulator
MILPVFLDRRPLYFPVSDPVNAGKDTGKGKDGRGAGVARLPSHYPVSARYNRGNNAPPGATLGKSVLIVEDEKEIRDLLALYLRKEGFDLSYANDGESGLSKARSEKPNLILLDILLPKMDGLEVLRGIRSDREIAGTPVIMLTAKGDETDRIVGLELGADDYVPKPFSPREVVARVKAIFRRSLPREVPAEGRIYRKEDLQLDVSRHEVRYRDKSVTLTTKEFRILEILMGSEGKVLSRETILSRVWGEGTYVLDRTVDVHIAKLRRKIPLLANAIETVKDVGYKLRET